MVDTIIFRPINIPRAKSAFVDSNTAGALLTIKRLLGSSSQLALLSSGTHSNLSVEGDTLKAANVLGDGISQTAIVRESLGTMAVEYPITLTGQVGLNPNPTPTPAPSPSPSVTMLRKDSVAPRVYPDSDEFGFVDVGATEFDLTAVVHASVIDVEVSFGAIDANNRYYVRVNTPYWQFYRVSGGNTELLNAGNIRNTENNEKIRFRVQRNPDFPQYIMLSMYLEAEKLYERGNVIPMTGGDGTKIYWHNYNPTRPTDVSTSPLVNPIVISNPALSSSAGNLHDLLRVPVDYVTLASQPDPTGIQIRQRLPDNTILVDWEDALLVSSTGAGQVDAVSRTPYTGQRGRLLKVDVRHKAVPTIKATIDTVYPEPLSIGQNVSHMNLASRTQRTYTNMMMQSEWQDSTSPFKGHNRGEVGDTLDEKGWPLRAGLWLYYPLPDQLTTVTYVFTWTGGDMLIQHIAMDDSVGVAEVGPIQRVDANTYKWTLRGDRRLARHLPQCRFQINSIDVNNPPKNLTLYLEGEDPTQRFLPSFINFLKQATGRLRFMDNRAVNGELTRYNVPWVFENRPTQDNGTPPADFIIEDMVELCYRSNRGLLYSVHSSYAYETGGLDYYDRELDIIYGKTPGTYSTPGFTAPGGVPKIIAPEMDNEIWNVLGFGGRGSFQYLARIANTRGFVAPFSESDGTPASAAVTMMRGKTHRILMERLQARIPDWRPRTSRVIGLQLGVSDLSNLRGSANWSDTDLFSDEFNCAPYIPDDPNAGGQSANIPDKSPAGICAFLAKSVKERISLIVVEQANEIARMGKKFGVYEINVSIPSLGISLDQNLALRKSVDYYNVWRDHIIPMMVRVGGAQELYADVSPILDGAQQQWGVYHYPNTEYNKAWEAVADWTAANPTA